MTSMWNAASDVDYDVAAGNGDLWDSKRCVACNAPMTDDSEICAACEEDIAPKSRIVREAAEAAGYEVVDLPAVEAEPDDFLGLPEIRACGDAHDGFCPDED